MQQVEHGEQDGILRYDHNANEMQFFTTGHKKMTVSGSGLTVTQGYPILAGRAATDGGRILAGHYNLGGGDVLAVLSTQYSSGAFIVGYGVEGKEGASGYVSTNDAFSGVRTAMQQDTGGFKFLTSAATQASPGTDITMTERVKIDENGFVIINQNDTGSAGSTLKQLSLGDSSSTQFDATNVASFTGMVLSNSYTSGSNQSGTATGIAFTHHSSSSGISYIASVAGSNSGDRSSLYFGTRGSGGVEERLRLEDNGEIFLGKGGDGYVRHYEIGGSNYWYLYATNSDKYNFNYNASGTPEMVISTSGNVTILGSLTEGSDIRLKENVETIPDALSKVNQMRGVSYNRIGEDEVKIGMVADEVEKIMPELVSIEPNEDVEGLENLKSLKYTNIIGLLVEAVKELSARLDDLEPEESEQEQSPTVKERVNSLEARVNDLENG